MLPGVDLGAAHPHGRVGGLAAIIFAESGLFFAFFLPGDSLLITAEVLASADPGAFSLWAAVLVCFVAAEAEDTVGYT